MKKLKNTWAKADTMSVIGKGCTSTSISIQLGEPKEDILDGEDDHSYCNATLRFDKGPKAVVCGYPQEWSVWSEPIEQYDYDSPTGEAIFDFGGYELEDLPELGFKHHISRVDEYNILAHLKVAIVKQFRDPTWKDHNDVHGKLEIIQKIDNALNDEKFSHIKKVA